MLLNANLPSLRSCVQIKFFSHNFKGEPTYNIFDPLTNNFFNIGWKEYNILSLWHLGDASAIIAEVNAATPLNICNEDIDAILKLLKKHNLIENFSSVSFIQMSRITKTSLFSKLMHNYLYFRFPLYHPDKFLTNVYNKLAWIFFTKTFWAMLFTATVFNFVLILPQLDTILFPINQIFSAYNLPIYLVCMVLAKCVHEMGHGLAAKHYNLEVPAFGVAFIVLTPMLYTDVTASWHLGDYRKRLAIVSAGVISEMILAALALFFVSFVSSDLARNVIFFFAILNPTLTLVINISPFIRFDGYYFLSDFWQRPNLQPVSFSLVRWHIRKMVLGHDTPPPTKYPTNLHYKLLSYGYITLIYRLFLFLSIAFMVYHFAFKLLGIILFAIEMIFFISLPIYLEIKTWRNMKFNRHNILFWICFTALTLFLVLPMPRIISLPAIMQSADYTTVFAPSTATIQQVFIPEVSKQIARNSTLLSLLSPELDKQVRLYNIKLELFNAKMRFCVEQPELTEVLKQQYLSTMSSLENAKTMIRDLNLVANNDSVLVESNNNLKPGAVINPKMPLATLVNKPSRADVFTYLPEEYKFVLPAKRTKATFVSNSNETYTLYANYVLSSAHTKNIEQPFFATTYGGHVPCTPGSGTLVPQTPFFRLRFSCDNFEAPTKYGFINIEITNISYLKRCINWLAQVLFQESDF